MQPWELSYAFISMLKGRTILVCLCKNDLTLHWNLAVISARENKITTDDMTISLIHIIAFSSNYQYKAICIPRKYMIYPKQFILMRIGHTIAVFTCKNDLNLFIWKPMYFISSRNSNFGQNITLKISYK